MPEISSTEFVGPEWRPRAWIASVTFSDGTVLQFGKHEVIVFVGPNNAGKSAALRDFYAGLQQKSHIGQVARGVNITRQGNGENAIRWAERVGWRKGGAGQFHFEFGSLHPHQIQGDWQNASDNGLGAMLPAVATIVSTEGRLGAANPVGNGNFVEQRPNSPLQILHEREDLEEKLSRLFKQAFGHELIVNRGAGTHIYLHLGVRPVPPEGKDRISIEYRRAVNALPQVPSQGDGIRSFVGVMLNAFVTDRDIILIDEPDAFLHPPQAALLGKMLATETTGPRP